MAFQEEVERSSQVAFISQSERKNARFQRYMEDTHKIIPCLDGDTSVFYASVFDGHGGMNCSLFLKIGKETANYVAEHLHENIIAARTSKELETTEQCLEYAYLYTDIESKKEDMKNSGSTGVTILILNEGDKRVVYSANAGDSRSLIFSDGETKRLSYVPCFLNLYDIL